MHKGKRIDGAEYFDDVLESGGVGGRGNSGILDSAGLDDYDSVRERILPEGVEVSVNCRLCNSKRGVLFEWPELYQIGSNGPSQPPLIPPGWQFSRNNGTVVFVAGCPACGQPGVALHVTPDEARRKVESAMNAGLLTPAVVQRWREAVARMRGQLR